MRISIIAVDLGPKRSGVAVLGRRHVTVRGYRHVAVDISTHTLTNTEVCDVLEELRPQLVLIEKAAEGYQQKEAKRALAKVEAAVDRRRQVSCIANVATWRTEAFGFHRVNKSVQHDVTMRALERLCGDDAARIWDETAGQANKDARSALILLCCWEPKEAILARGRWGTAVVFSRHSRKAGKGRLAGLSRGAARLYEVLWMTAERGTRAGMALQCKAAGVSTKSYKRYLKELAYMDLIERGQAGEIVL